MVTRSAVRGGLRGMGSWLVRDQARWHYSVCCGAAQHCSFLCSAELGGGACLCGLTGGCFGCLHLISFSGEVVVPVLWGVCCIAVIGLMGNAGAHYWPAVLTRFIVITCPLGLLGLGLFACTHACAMCAMH